MRALPNRTCRTGESKTCAKAGREKRSIGTERKNGEPNHFEGKIRNLEKARKKDEEQQRNDSQRDERKAEKRASSFVRTVNRQTDQPSRNSRSQNNQIGEADQIFKDLAVLVNEQGIMIDDIDSNIEKLSDQQDLKQGTCQRKPID